MIAKFDELNLLESNVYEEYFADMDLSEKQKKDRVNLAMLFAEDFVWLLFLLREYELLGITPDDTGFTERYRDHVLMFSDDTDYAAWYAAIVGGEYIRSTMQNADTDYFWSADRVVASAENEAQNVLNRTDYYEAILSGKTQKTWLDVRDRRERKTHLRVGRTTIPITDVFEVGKTFMRFPHDYEFAEDHPEELISCRCSIVYK